MTVQRCSGLGNSFGSLSNAEAGEDEAEDIVGMNRMRDFAEGVEGGAEEAGFEFDVAEAWTV
jgi:hypothetical protein